MTGFRRYSLMLAGAMVAASCSGSGSADDAITTVSSTASPTVSPTTADAATPASTQPPVPTTSSATTDATTEATTSTAPPSTTTSAAQTLFCDDSAFFHVAVRAADFIDIEQPPQIEAVFDEMVRRVPAAVLSAPTEDDAAPAVRMGELLDIIVAEFEAIGYDVNSVDEPSATLAAAGAEFEDIADRLAGFLDASCDFDMLLLEDAAVEYADTLADPDAPSGAAGEDASGTITVDLPPGWTDVNGEPLEGNRRLIIAPDVAEFEQSWLADGARITVVDVEPGTADPIRLIDFADAEGECALQDIGDYDDGLYVGETSAYTDCGDTATQAFVVAATDFDRSVEILVEIQFVDDPTVIDVILASFVVL